MSALKADILKMVIAAWEKLPGGQSYSASQVAEWLVRDMKPVIDMARTYVKTYDPTGIDLEEEVERVLKIRNCSIRELQEIVNVADTALIKYQVEDVVWKFLCQNKVKYVDNSINARLRWTGD